MVIRIILSSFFAVLAACSGGAEGVVLDGDSYQPVPHMTLTLESSGWGMRDGELVWDATKLERAESDSEGRFRFKGVGGINITIEGPNYDTVTSSLCARVAPVYVGGPNPGVAANDVLLLPISGTEIPDQAEGDLGGRFVSTAIGLEVSGAALSSGQGELSIQAIHERQLVFVSGTGNIPAAPSHGWTRRLSLKLPQDCGWAFVAERGNTIGVVKVGPLGRVQTIQGYEAATMQFTPLP